MLLPRCCPLCEAPGPAPCAACAAAWRAPGPVPPLPGLVSVAACFAYEGAPRQLLLRLKYGNRRDPVVWLGARLGAVGPPGVDVVTWAPTSTARRAARGFDQAELLARATGRARGVPVRRALRRQGAGHQTGRSAGARRAGPAFVARGRVPPCVLVVDDVGTTGATLVAAAAALHAAGARAVHAAVVAWTPPPGQGVSGAAAATDVASCPDSARESPGGPECRSPSAAARRW